MKVYADTSVFGGVFDGEFAEASRKFFDEVSAGRYELAVSVIVREEIKDAPADVRDFYRAKISDAEILDFTTEALDLQEAYLAAGIVTAKSAADAGHVAMATVLGCQMIVSWNSSMSCVLTKSGGIMPSTNRTVIIGLTFSLLWRQFAMAIPEPKCAQWKRKGQRALMKKLAGMTRAEGRAFWRESYKKMLSEQAESKRRAQAETGGHSPSPC